MPPETPSATYHPTKLQCPKCGNIFEARRPLDDADCPRCKGVMERLRLDDPQTRIFAGLTVGTMFSLQGADETCVKVTHGGPSPDGLYAGWILTLEGRAIINSAPIFVSAETAEEHMKDLLKRAQTWQPPKA